MLARSLQSPSEVISPRKFSSFRKGHFVDEALQLRQPMLDHGSNDQCRCTGGSLEQDRSVGL